jgi:hypothetical protein
MRGLCAIDPKEQEITDRELIHRNCAGGGLLREHGPWQRNAMALIHKAHQSTAIKCLGPVAAISVRFAKKRECIGSNALAYARDDFVTLGFGAMS